MPLLLISLLALAVILAVAAVAIARRYRRPTAARPKQTLWRPSVQHRELPPPLEDPVISQGQPQAEWFLPGAPPLPQLRLTSTVRGQLDGHALGRAKRILDAPDLLHHAATDPESWPNLEQAVIQTLALAESRGVKFADRGRISQALALPAAQGILLAEWRQLEDGRTAWDGESAQIRASDAFTIRRIAEVMYRRLLPDVFAGIERRPPDFDPALIVPYTIALAFYLRLHGNPPKAFAA